MKNQIKILAMGLMGLAFTLTSCSTEELFENSFSKNGNEQNIIDNYGVEDGQHADLPLVDNNFQTKSIAYSILVLGQNIQGGDCVLEHEISIESLVTTAFDRIVTVQVVKNITVRETLQLRIPANTFSSNTSNIFYDMSGRIGEVGIAVIDVRNAGTNGVEPFFSSGVTMDVNNCYTPTDLGSSIFDVSSGKFLNSIKISPKTP